MDDDLLPILIPEILERQAALRNGKRLVHYTTAEAAFGIITSAEIWLRNAAIMNDFSEIQHGLNCLDQGLRSGGGQQLRDLLNRLREGASEALDTAFQGLEDGLRNGTFLISLSEHEGPGEDKLGRLSMWRAYGRRSGVALVLNSAPFYEQTSSARIYSAPVFYRSPAEFVDWFQSWVDGLIGAEDRLRAMPHDEFLHALVIRFATFALCTKHPGFWEEREWRVFHALAFNNLQPDNPIVPQVIAGLPQLIIKVPLVDRSAENLGAWSPQQLINRVIIGPCEYPLQVRAAMISAMNTAHIASPLEKIWMSLIPLRH